MPKAVEVKAAVKETLIGSEDSVPVSVQTKARFNKNAAKDPESEELFMGPEEFINAVAPADEDFVSQPPPSLNTSPRDSGAIAGESQLTDNVLSFNSTRSSATSTDFCSP